MIGTRARYVAKKDALACVAGYCVINDVSEREFQLERGRSGTRARAATPSDPIGPWLVTPDEIANVQKLDMWLDVNGKRMQTGNTRTMIFDVRQARELRQPVHDADAGRRHHHRHAAGRGPGHEAARPT